MKHQVINNADGVSIKAVNPHVKTIEYTFFNAPNQLYEKFEAENPALPVHEKSVPLVKGLTEWEGEVEEIPQMQVFNGEWLDITNDFYEKAKLFNNTRKAAKLMAPLTKENEHGEIKSAKEILLCITDVGGPVERWKALKAMEAYAAQFKSPTQSIDWQRVEQLIKEAGVTEYDLRINSVIQQIITQFKAPAIDTGEKKDLIDKINSMVIPDDKCGIDYQTGYNDALTDIIYTLKS